MRADVGATASAVTDSLALSWQASRRRTVLAALLQLLGAVSALVTVYASKLTLDGLLATDRGGRSLTTGLVLLVVSTAVAGSIGTFQQQQQRMVGESVSQILWRRVLDVSSRVELITWETAEFLSRLDRVRYNALQAPTQVVSSLYGAAGGVVGVVVLTVGLAGISAWLVPVLLLTGVPVLVFSRLASASEFRFVAGTNDLQRSRLYLKQLLTGRSYAAEVRAFDASTHLLDRHRRQDADYLRVLGAQTRRRQALGLAAAASSAVGLAMTFGVIVLLVRTGSLSLAQAGAAAVGARILAGQLSTVFSAVSAFVEAAPLITDMRAFVALSPPWEGEPPKPRRLTSEIVAREVSFSYPGAARPAVQRATVRVPRGGVVALVGENGSGKTTLAKLLGGLYEPSEGAVLWDGEPAQAPVVRASSSVLFQNFVRYQMTAGENIAISDAGRPVDPGTVPSVAHQARIHDVIASLPEGYDTALGIELAEGADLSGGEWQRLALARALFRGRDLLILDEPSAALDPRAEHELFNDVRGVLEGRSALLISHRYSSVRLADYIYVLDDGEIREEGTHDELVAAGGRYAELFALQAATFLGHG